MWSKSFFHTIILLLSIGISFQMTAQDNVIDEVIWVVGDEPILKSEVENRRKDLLSSLEEIEGDPYCVIAEQIALEKLYMHQAKLDSIEPLDTEVIQEADARLNRMVTDLGSEERLEDYFEMPYSQIRENVRSSVRVAQAVRSVQQGLVKDVKVTPSEVRRYFSKLPQDSVPFIETQVEVQILVIEPKISQQEIESVKTKLRGFAERVNNGEIEFSTLARLYGEDESSRKGGELGFKGKAELVPEFSAVAFNLNNTDRVSKIVETEFGFHIIQLIEKRGDRINCRHIVMKPHPSNQEKEEALTRLDSIVNAIHKNELTFESAVIYFSTDKNTRNNKGLLANDMKGTALSQSRFKMEELPSAVAKMVNSLQEGEISKPFIMIDPKTNKEVCSIVKLQKRIAGHKASANEDYQEMSSIVEMKKKEDILAKWIAKKQKSTYVRISEKWKNCDFKYDGWIVNE